MTLGKSLYISVSIFSIYVNESSSLFSQGHNNTGSVHNSSPVFWLFLNEIFTIIRQIHANCEKLKHYMNIQITMEKAMAPHSSTLAWKIPWTEEPGGLPSMGSHRVGHD